MDLRRQRIAKGGRRRAERTAVSDDALRRGEAAFLLSSLRLHGGAFAFEVPFGGWLVGARRNGAKNNDNKNNNNNNKNNDNKNNNNNKNNDNKNNNNNKNNDNKNNNNNKNNDNKNNNNKNNSSKNNNNKNNKKNNNDDNNKALSCGAAGRVPPWFSSAVAKKRQKRWLIGCIPRRREQPLNSKKRIARRRAGGERCMSCPLIVGRLCWLTMKTQTHHLPSFQQRSSAPHQKEPSGVDDDFNSPTPDVRLYVHLGGRESRRSLEERKEANARHEVGLRHPTDRQSSKFELFGDVAEQQLQR